MKNAFFFIDFSKKKNLTLIRFFIYFGVYIAKMYIHNTKVTLYILNHNCLLSIVEKSIVEK